VVVENDGPAAELLPLDLLQPTCCLMRPPNQQQLAPLSNPPYLLGGIGLAVDVLTGHSFSKLVHNQLDV